MALNTTAGTLVAGLLARLSADPNPDPDREMLVLAALEGPAALTGYLDGSAAPKRPELPTATAAERSAREPLGAYLKSIMVEGFRGVGPKKTLDLPPGPGLTLVVGRNGSGKSSFAEALELLLTGDTYRWKKPRSAVWREGWRNLHHKPAAIEAEFYVEGDKPTRVVSQWKDDGDLENAETFAQTHGKKQIPVGDLGWAPAVKTYQPILSYNELGSMLDQGPSKLFDAVSAILGLEELTEGQETLAEARKARDKAHKEAGETRDQILARLRDLDDDRARALLPAMGKRDWGLDAVEASLRHLQARPSRATFRSSGSSPTCKPRRPTASPAPSPEQRRPQPGLSPASVRVGARGERGRGLDRGRPEVLRSR